MMSPSSVGARREVPPPPCYHELAGELLLSSVRNSHASISANRCSHLVPKLLIGSGFEKNLIVLLCPSTAGRSWPPAAQKGSNSISKMGSDRPETGPIK